MLVPIMLTSLLNGNLSKGRVEFSLKTQTQFLNGHMMILEAMSTNDKFSFIAFREF